LTARNGPKSRRRVLWHIRLWLGLTVGILIMYVLLRRVDIGELYRYMQGVKLVPFAISMLVFMSSFVVRAYQWKYVLADTQPRRVRHLFTAMMIGFAANFVLPARAGEFIRAGVLSRREGTPFTTSFASVVATRLLDGLCFICLLTLALFLLRLDEPLTIPAGRLLAEPFVITPEKLALAATITAAAFLIATACAVALYMLRERATRLVECAVRPVSGKLSVWIAGKLGTFIEGFTVFGHGSRFVCSLGLTVVVWTMAIGSLYPLMMAFPMGMPLPWWSVLVVGAFANLGAMIPLSPGFIGTFHACVIAALKLCNPGIDYDVAVAFALVLHGAQLVLLVLVGIISLWVENVPMAAVRRSTAVETAQPGSVADAGP